MGYGEMFKGLEQLFVGLLVTCIISVPLGLWKLVDIIIWIVKHVRVSIG